MQFTIPIKAMSVNEAYKIGNKRFYKSAEYKEYIEDVYRLLPRTKIKGEVEIFYTVHINSYAQSDVDNFNKPLTDIIEKKGIIENDNKVVLMQTEKVKCKKGEEKIEVEIIPYENAN